MTGQESPLEKKRLQIVDGKEPTASRRYRVQLLGVVPDLDRQVRSYTLVAGKDLGSESSDTARF